MTFIVPNSAAMAAPTRPATIKPVSTGPSSLHIETLTTASVAVSILTLWNWLYVCAASTMPVNAPVIKTTDCDFTPTKYIWYSRSFHATFRVNSEAIVS